MFRLKTFRTVAKLRSRMSLDSNRHIAIDKLYTTTILLLFVLPSVGTAQIFGPSNYEDCIIEGMQGVASDVAAVAVRSACREKFPSNIKHDKPAIRLVKGKDFSIRYSYEGDILTIGLINRSSKSIRYVGLTNYDPCLGRTNSDIGDDGSRGNVLSGSLAISGVRPGEMEDVIKIGGMDADLKRKLSDGSICLLPTVYHNYSSAH